MKQTPSETEPESVSVRVVDWERKASIKRLERASSVERLKGLDSKQDETEVC